MLMMPFKKILITRFNARKKYGGESDKICTLTYG